MQLRKLFSFALAGLIMQNAAFSQVGTLNLINLPPSPDAAALGKFVEAPVGSYSRIPSVNIPLYELDVNELKVPGICGPYCKRT